MRIPSLAVPLLASLLVAAAPATAATVTYRAPLSGAAEVPPNPSPGTGAVTVDIVDGLVMTVSASFADLLAPSTIAHIHNAPAGANGPVMTAVPTFPGFPAGVTSGSYTSTFDLMAAGSWNPAFLNTYPSIDAARLAFLAALSDGAAYFNLHSTLYPGGELRGQLTPVPLPATALLALAAFGLLGALRRR
jgi:hypothetical protein